ncbi:fimbrial protein [Acinetobacter guillouiae]|uniref:fimbrial protein n=1 Tax=Acinetobacter guillouiae TaxID=106649 RepID=UPI003AF5762D
MRNKGINMKFSIRKYKIKQSQVYGSVLLCLFSNMYITQAQAESDIKGWWREEEIREIDAGFTKDLKPGENFAGSSININPTANINGQRWISKCLPGVELAGSSRTTVYTEADYGDATPVLSGGWYYIRVNEYLDVAMEFYTNGVTVKVPFRPTRIGNQDQKCANARWEEHSGSVSYSMRLKIAKPFIGFNHFRVPVAYFYSGDRFGTARAQGAAQTIFLVGTVTVPETCKINVTNNITIDFGKISKNAFVQAGAGNKPAGVNEKTEQLSITCSGLNSNASALMTLRLESQGAQGDMMVSNDKAVGFKVANAADGKILIPNSYKESDLIKFTYMPPKPSNITLKFWPVSVNGMPPTLGKFRAEGYLRVDYN